MNVNAKVQGIMCAGIAIGGLQSKGYCGSRNHNLHLHSSVFRGEFGIFALVSFGDAKWSVLSGKEHSENKQRIITDFFLLQCWLMIISVEF